MVDVKGRGRIHICECEKMGGYKVVWTWEITDISENGRIQMCKDMGGYRCVRSCEDADI